MSLNQLISLLIARRRAKVALNRALRPRPVPTPRAPRAPIATAPTPLQVDLLSALKNLGWKELDARRKIATMDLTGLDFDQAFRKLLSGV